ncbi:lytic polysaccharide monooxygenase [Streptomyces sp. NPDC058691]|uniref:lytic polysaccharide monooxygenase n=1 Tax=Streptomyces sp. NPDC058691 TaxID=3346601 RepID=UPI00366361A0
MAPSRHVLRTVVAGTAALLPLLASAGPAAAHGAPVDPVSRAAACAAGSGRFTGTPACRAAAAANGGGAAFADWDNLRVAGVGGRDRQVIPDGKLCSGGLPAYRGLDLARGDWPATRLTPGAPFTMRYGTTIPHQGTFRLYLTKQGYDPTRPLTWSEVASSPFLTATDPAIQGGAYRISGRLPADRTGRHVLFTIWQNSSTPDTYYSCSDVVFPAAGKPAGGTPAKPKPKPAVSVKPSPRATRASAPAERRVTATPGAHSAVPSPASPSAAPAVGSPDAQPVAAQGSGAGSGPTALAIGSAAGLAATGVLALALRRRRSPGTRRG